MANDIPARRSSITRRTALATAAAPRPLPGTPTATTPPPPRSSTPRRTALATAAALVAAPALAEECRIGPPPHEKGPLVWMGMDQTELDAAYDQSFYSPLMGQILKRYASNSEITRARLGQPQREAYGP